MKSCLSVEGRQDFAILKERSDGAMLPLIIFLSVVCFRCRKRPLYRREMGKIFGVRYSSTASCRKFLRPLLISSSARRIISALTFLGAPLNTSASILSNFPPNSRLSPLWPTTSCSTVSTASSTPSALGIQDTPCRSLRATRSGSA